MIYGDEQRLLWPGAGNAGGRVICAANRPADTPYPVTTGRDRHGDYVRFAPMQDDKSANERRQYGTGRSPKRAMIALESLGAVPRFDRIVEHEFGLVLEKGAPLIPHLFAVIDQENAAPPKGENWRPPPMSFGAVAVPRPRSRTVDEYLQLSTNRWDPAARKPVEAGVVRMREPVVRGAFHRIELRFRNGRGGPGLLELRVDGESQGRYTGDVGYERFGPSFPGFGAYLHWGQAELATRIYGWTRRVVPA